MRKFITVVLVLYLIAAGLAALVGVYDPPGRAGCDVTWCGMIGYLSVFAIGLPWSYIATVKFANNGVAAYWACWACVALNLGLLFFLARRAGRSLS